MTEFVGQFRHWDLSSPQDIRSFYIKIYEYAKLLQTPLSLSQFIPCNEKGEPMEKPYRNDIPPDKDSDYQKALDKVLFEGCTKEPMIQQGNVMTGGKQIVYYKALPDYFIWSGKTIEDLINSEIKLTPTSACRKMIGIMDKSIQNSS